MIAYEALKSAEKKMQRSSQRPETHSAFPGSENKGALVFMT